MKNTFLKDVFVKNSKKSALDKVSKTLVTLNINENTSSDIEAYEGLIGDVIERVGVTSILPYITSVIPTAVPQGKVPMLTAKYVGKNINGISVTENLVVLTVTDDSAFDVDGDISSDNGGVGVIQYKETKQLLIKVTNGSFSVGDNLDNAATYADSKAVVEATRSNVVGVGGILKDYSGPYSTNVAETKEFANSTAIDLQLKQATVNVKSRKLFSGLTQEFVQDLLTMYGQSGKEKLIRILATSIEQCIEQETFDFMRAISKQQSDIIIKDPGSTGLSISQAYEDIISRIYFSIGRIGTQTNIAGEFFVVGSSNVMAAIAATGRMKPVDEDVGTNTKYDGLLDGAIRLIEDPYSFDDYLIVGLVGPDDFDNAGVIVCPYNVDFIEAINPDTLQTEIAVLNRYDIIRSPLDTKTVSGDSDFFEWSLVDFSNVAK